MMGAYWYDEAEERVVYFGADYWMVFQQGPGRFLSDFLVDLNDHWLDAPTIFEQVEGAGYRSASVNWFVYKGDKEHSIDFALLNLLPTAPAGTTIWGPSTLHLGDFTNHSKNIDDEKIGTNGGVFDRLGFSDDVTHELLMQLVNTGKFPDFTLAYFPDNDFESHEVGPANALPVVEQFDAYLGELFEAYGGMQAMLDDVAIIITGDHSQADIGEDNPAIDLTQVIPDFPAADVGKGFNGGSEIIACPNGRVAPIYLRDLSQENINHLIDDLLEDDRIDQVICLENYRNAVEKGYHVFTCDRGDLHFGRTEGDGEEVLYDHYGGEWHWRGDLSVFGESQQDGDVTTFPEYPNPFERIANLLDSPRSGHIWATAKPGYEFVIPGVEAHPGGGSHGSLHIQDSSPPLFAAGLPDGVTVPEHPRLVDLAPLCLEILGIKHAVSAGESRL